MPLAARTATSAFPGANPGCRTERRLACLSWRAGECARTSHAEAHKQARAVPRPERFAIYKLIVADRRQVGADQPQIQKGPQSGSVPD